MPDFLSNVEEEENISIIFPSGVSYLYKPLSTPQLKEILQSVVDTTIGGNSFLKTANKILGNNIVLEEGQLGPTFTIRDRDVVLYNLRLECIGDDWKDKTLKSIDFQGAKGILSEEVVKFKDFAVTISTPTISRESKLQVHLQPSAQDLEPIIGDLFLREIAKHVTTITYKDQTCEFPLLSGSEQLKLIEKLPANLIHKVAKSIEKAQKEWNSLLSVDGESINIDPEFFS